MIFSLQMDIFKYILNFCLGTDSELDSGIQEKGDTTDEDIKVRNLKVL